MDTTSTGHLASAPPPPVSAGPHGTRLPRSSTLLLTAAFVVAAVVYLVICLHQPIQFNTYADKDDAYLVHGAQMMVDGDWLGDYTQLTLIKGPGFIYFLVVNHLLGTSVTLTSTLLYIASCGALVRVLSRYLLLHRGLSLALFVLLLFQPVLMPTRLVRDNLYHSLFLLVLAGMSTLALDPRTRGRLLRSLAWGLPLGLFWITREEGIWVLPALGVAVLLRSWAARHTPRELLTFGGALVAFVVGASVPVLATSSINQAVYGSFTVTDLNAAPFQSAVKTLDSVVAGEQIPHVTVTRKELREAYAASPALAELRPTLEDPDNIWLKPGCGVYPETCGQYAGGWFGWAVRDAAQAAGRYTTASEASAYFDRVAAELSDACARGTLTCRPGLVPVGPVVSIDTLRLLPSTMLKGALLTAYQGDADPPLLTTAGLAVDVDDWTDFLGDPAVSTFSGDTPVLAPEDHAGWVQLRHDLAGVYAIVGPIVVVAGLLSFLVGVLLLAVRRPVQRSVLAAAGVCWLLWLSRLGLMSLIDITASPAIATYYLEPAVLAVFLASSLSIVAIAPLRPLGSTETSEARRPPAQSPTAARHVGAAPRVRRHRR